MRVLFQFFIIFFVCFRVVFAQFACGVRISEFLPNPVGDDAAGEFIELENTCNEIKLLDGVTVSDRYGTTKSFILNGFNIEPRGLLVLRREQTLISLNNDVEQVELTDAQGVLIDRSDVYEVVQEGYALARFDQNWQVVPPTLGQANVEPTLLPSPAPNLSVSPTPSAFVSPTPSATPITPTHIRLNEISPCNGSPEWVEFHNNENSNVSLEGWWIQDSTTQKKYLDDIVVPAHGYAIYEWNGYFLNNDGDSVRLFLNNKLIDNMTYDGCTDTTTWQRFGEQLWLQQANITKASQNILLEEPILIEEETMASISASVSTRAKNSLPQKRQTHSFQDLHWLEPSVLQTVSEQRIFPISTRASFPNLLFLFTSTLFFEAFGGLSIAWYNLKE